MGRRTFGVWLGGSTFLAAALVVWMGRATARPKGAEDPDPGHTEASLAPPALGRRVRTAPVVLEPLAREWEGHGVVRASDRALLAFTVTGRLRERPVQVGDRVRKGQRLAWVESTGFRHMVDAVEAEVARAESQLSQRELDAQRFAQLGGAGAVTKEQVERAGSELDSAAASARAARVELREAARALGETVLRAPFDAVVTSVRVEPGETVRAGEPVVEVSGRDGREVRLEVPIGTAASVRPGAPVKVGFPLLRGGKAWPAQVLSVGAATDGRAGLLPVTVLLSANTDSQAVPGTAARIRIALDSDPELSVPVAAIVDPVGLNPAVFRVRDGKVERVPVRIASLVATRVIVEGNLEHGQPLVISGSAALRSGDQVQVVP